MEDQKIIELYRQRNESAIEHSKVKYGTYCRSISERILGNKEDAAECENDTYLKAWNSIPPDNPSPLSSYLGMITRNLSLDLLRRKSAKKRSDRVCISFNELEECIPSQMNISEQVEAKELAKIVSDFLRGLSVEECNIFLNRYWYFLSIKEIAVKYGFTQSKVKMMLLRTRKKLATHLEKEGIFV